MEPKFLLQKIEYEDIITLSNVGDELPEDGTDWGDLEGDTGDEDWL